MKELMKNIAASLIAYAIVMPFVLRYEKKFLEE